MHSHNASDFNHLYLQLCIPIMILNRGLSLKVHAGDMCYLTGHIIQIISGQTSLSLKVTGYVFGNVWLETDCYQWVAKRSDLLLCMNQVCGPSWWKWEVSDFECLAICIVKSILNHGLLNQSALTCWQNLSRVKKKKKNTGLENVAHRSSPYLAFDRTWFNQ